MGDTKIQWTEKTWNPVTGCDKVSAGCKFCYAEDISIRFWKGRKFNDVQFHPDRLEIPLSWREPKMVFVNSMSDLFHEKVKFEEILDIFDVMCTDTILKCKKCRDWRHYHNDVERLKYSKLSLEEIEVERNNLEEHYKLDEGHDETEDCYKEVPKHTYQVLTKRPERALEFMEWLKEEQKGDFNMSEEEHPFLYYLNENGWTIPGNIWMGVTAENQELYAQRGKLLKKIPAKVRFLSLEPLLGEIWLDVNIEMEDKSIVKLSVKDWDWIIVGCESGSKMRICDLRWVEKIVRVCKEYRDHSLMDSIPQTGIPVFVKQLQLLQGGTKGWASKDVYVEKDMEKFPEHLRVREYPKIF